MARSKETFSKKEVRNKKEKKRKDKEARREAKKDQEKKSSLEDMLAYVDENGNISDTPPDPTKKKEIKLENIEISVPEREDIAMEGTIRKGVVTFFNVDKGYGFIRDKETQESIFVHQNNVEIQLKENNVVTFEIEKSPKGFSAFNVKLSN
ncbi:MAG TPA: DNA-binding protein [Bacteroidetes bacterium]|jgi:cold shock CspA family protein|nr:MAG: DNA-binding protein [Sphingobacteriales bacterium BACL12 MAG-120802-bin5]HCK22064.1 DNA-binding protein [Bacteroidota bacterium]